ncbi:catalase A [Coemansia sp. RSA 1937]|nr:catalase A [Coemansia sp. RSA 1937]
MHGYSSHTYKLINHNGLVHYVKWHFRTNQGVKNLSAKHAEELAGTEPDYAIQDLFNAIERKEYPSWTLYFQVLTEKEALNYKYDVLDVTKVISQKDFPLQEVGRFVLDRNPENYFGHIQNINYFAEVEQAAFAPSHLVPGIAPSADRMLQGRLFSYTDTHLHRLGPNHAQLPINSPITPINTTIRDGPLIMGANGGRNPPYYPNSYGGPHPDPNVREYENDYNVEGIVGRYEYELCERDFEQPRALFKLLAASEQQDLISNLAEDVAMTHEYIQRRVVGVLERIDATFAKRVQEALAKS